MNTGPMLKVLIKKDSDEFCEPMFTDMLVAFFFGVIVKMFIKMIWRRMVET
jgi:hypothetical protein